jgi:hypothetical protein
MVMVSGVTYGASAGSSAGAPPGATAVCRDGTYSYSRHHSGTCSRHGGVARWLGASPSPASAPSGASGTLGRTVVLAARTRAHGCRRGALPDRRCSPGAYYTRVTKAVICSSTFRTSSIRHVPDSVRHAVEREYGMAARSYGHALEIDHIVPLELGGSNEITNLFPEAGAGAAGYHVKDRLEDRLHTMVCTGRMTLGAARRGIASDWTRLYDRVFGASL